jgi:hypothetical protein
MMGQHISGIGPVLDLIMDEQIYLVRLENYIVETHCHEELKRVMMEILITMMVVLQYVSGKFQHVHLKLRRQVDSLLYQ